ncbi:BfmA/BtgA family mobilization protein [Formosa haliotis]|uniref:BfmA/BtgA family mobilization protein n=1 Tax=Formosa haliotis TaxID=1555194 RepID=UPI00082692E0|nr:BfmA/BtgA family mobilization protein [Formosa haliotis]
MDTDYKGEKFKNLKFKISIAEKFQRFSKSIGKSQSITLLMMLEFFERNDISPDDNLGPRMETLEKIIKKRFNGMIAIIKDIEKHQTKPTAAMLEALFEQAIPKKKPRIIERKYREAQSDNNENNKNT